MEEQRHEEEEEEEEEERGRQPGPALVAYDPGPMLRSLKDDIGKWMIDRYRPQIPFVEGGWESWMQIDFLAWLFARDPTFDCRREVPEVIPLRYKGKDEKNVRIDWVFNSNPQTRDVEIETRARRPKRAAYGADDRPTSEAPADSWAVELKAQGYKYVAKKLIKDVDKDLQKLRLLKRKKYNRKLMIIALTDDGTWDHFWQLGWRNCSHHYAPGNEWPRSLEVTFFFYEIPADEDEKQDI